VADDLNVYCDESCHLEHDGQSVMLLGAIWCPRGEASGISRSIREIKEAHGARGELKWTKVSPSRGAFFNALVDFFFETPLLNFRCLVVREKGALDHSYFNRGSHESFYYKMYFYLLRNILMVENRYWVYLDIKDTRSQMSVSKLREILSNSLLDFEQTTIERIQQIRSTESELLQLADFLIGAISYVSRGLESSATKSALVERIKSKCHLTLTHSTPPWEEKFNLFFFQPRKAPK